MPFDFSLPEFHVRSPSETPTNIAGEDISLRSGDMSETSNGDLATVVGVPAAKQSVDRELPANPGSFPRRPQWGAGIGGMLFKNSTVAQRDRAVSRSRARMIANPRIVRVHEVTAKAEDQGFSLSYRADAVGGHLDSQTLVKPPGVR